MASPTYRLWEQWHVLIIGVSFKYHEIYHCCIQFSGLLVNTSLFSYHYKQLYSIYKTLKSFLIIQFILIFFHVSQIYYAFCIFRFVFFWKFYMQGIIENAQSSVSIFHFTQYFSSQMYFVACIWCFPYFIAE